MRRLTYGCIAVLLGTAPLVRAATQVQVVGLFPGAAVLSLEGQRQLVRVGQTGPGGVEVVSADSRGAVLRVDGVERAYSLSREVGASRDGSPGVRHSVARGVGGHYWPVGAVNGHSVQFLLDTGATYVTLSEPNARRIGIDFAQGSPILVSTASGQVKGWKVRIDSVKVGHLEVTAVDAVVLEGEAPGEVLLGMSFLGRVGWREEGGALLLESRS